MAGRVVFLLALLAGTAAAAPIRLEQSVDGGRTFIAAGAITIQAVAHGATALLERSPLGAEQQGQLARLIASNGLYRLRLPSAQSGAPPVATSFPARCLAAAAAPGGLALDLLDGGHIAGLSLNTPCTRGAANAPAAATELPSTQALALRLPFAAPDVLQLVAPTQQTAAAASAAGLQAEPAVAQQAQAQAAQRQGQRQGQEGKAAGEGKDGGKAKEEEKTWLQRNWMVVMPLGFILVNILGGGNQPRGGGAAAPVRAVPARR